MRKNYFADIFPPMDPLFRTDGTFSDTLVLVYCRRSINTHRKKLLEKNTVTSGNLALVVDNDYFGCELWKQQQIYLQPCDLTISDRALLMRLLPVDDRRRKVLDFYKYEWIIAMRDAPARVIGMRDGRRRANAWLIENYDNHPTAKPKTSNHFDMPNANKMGKH